MHNTTLKYYALAMMCLTFGGRPVRLYHKFDQATVTQMHSLLRFTTETPRTTGAFCQHGRPLQTRWQDIGSKTAQCCCGYSTRRVRSWHSKKNKGYAHLPHQGQHHCTDYVTTMQVSVMVSVELKPWTPFATLEDRLLLDCFSGTTSRWEMTFFCQYGGFFEHLAESEKAFNAFSCEWGT